MNKTHNSARFFGPLSLAAALLLTGCATAKVEVSTLAMVAPSGQARALKADGVSAFQLERADRGASRCKDVYAFTYGERVAGDAVAGLGDQLAGTSLTVELIAASGEPFACAKPAPVTTALTVATGIYLFTGPTKVIELKYGLRVMRYNAVVLMADVDYNERESHNILTGHADGIYERAATAMVEESMRKIKEANLL